MPAALDAIEKISVSSYRIMPGIPRGTPEKDRFCLANQGYRVTKTRNGRISLYFEVLHFLIALLLEFYLNFLNL